MKDEGQVYWERHVRHYDRSLRLLNSSLPKLLEEIEESTRGANRVLEVAAGTGLVTAALSRTAGEVIATDYAREMVQTLDRRARERNWTNVRCEQADIYALRYPPESFDAVVAANVLHLVPDLPGAIAACLRVLKPGGRFIAPTFCHDETWLSATVSRVLSLTGFPGQRRFTTNSLVASLQENGIKLSTVATLPGLIPITFVEGRSGSASSSNDPASRL